MLGCVGCELPRCGGRAGNERDLTGRNYHAVYHRRHSAGRLAAGPNRDVYDRPDPPCAVGRRSRVIRRRAAERPPIAGIVESTRRGTSALIETEPLADSPSTWTPIVMQGGFNGPGTADESQTDSGRRCSHSDRRGSCLAIRAKTT